MKKGRKEKSRGDEGRQEKTGQENRQKVKEARCQKENNRKTNVNPSIFKHTHLHLVYLLSQFYEIDKSRCMLFA